MGVGKIFCWPITLLTKIMDGLSPIAALAVRLYVAQVFFMSGYSKIQSWTTTINLFQYEYQVPYLDPTMAAYLGTACELGLPILLVLGLGGRIAPLGLFIFNIVAVISYPFLHTPDGLVGLKDHMIWGSLIAIPLFWGVGKISLDHWFQRKCPSYQY